MIERFRAVLYVVQRSQLNISTRLVFVLELFLAKSCLLGLGELNVPGQLKKKIIYIYISVKKICLDVPELQATFDSSDQKGWGDVSKVRLDLHGSCDIFQGEERWQCSAVCGLTRVAWRPLQVAVARPRVWQVVREQWRRERWVRRGRGWDARVVRSTVAW